MGPGARETPPPWLADDGARILNPQGGPSPGGGLEPGSRCSHLGMKEGTSGFRVGVLPLEPGRAGTARGMQADALPRVPVSSYLSRRA